jgi:transcriptional regulator with XRE-family HTH domain
MAVEDHPNSRSAYGDELRERREAAGLTQEELSGRAIMSRTHIAHIEAGRRKPNIEDARRLDQVFGTRVFERFLPSLDGRKVAEHFQAAAVLEEQATMIRQWSPTLIHGLLQTPEYSRAVFRSGFPPRSTEDCDKYVSTRLDRARILNDTLSPVFWSLLDEGVLRRPVGGPAVMAHQLHHIAQLAEDERIRVHVMPYSVGQHALLESAVTLMEFEDQPPVAYVEGLHTGSLLELPAVVQLCQAAYDQALGDALCHSSSLAMIKAVAEEYER